MKQVEIVADNAPRTLANLHPSPGSHRKRKRLGRGIGSGLGKTAGKGHKGQRARKGGGIAPGFEGGQMPLYRRLPKRGFKNHFRDEYSVVNLDRLGAIEADVITPEVLSKVGLIGNAKALVKILGRGKVAKPLRVRAHRISVSARQAIESAGGVVESIEVKRQPVKNSKKKPKISK